MGRVSLCRAVLRAFLAKQTGVPKSQLPMREIPPPAGMGLNKYGILPAGWARGRHRLSPPLWGDPERTQPASPGHHSPRGRKPEFSCCHSTLGRNTSYFLRFRGGERIGMPLPASHCHLNSLFPGKSYLSVLDSVPSGLLSDTLPACLETPVCSPC